MKKRTARKSSKKVSAPRRTKSTFNLYHRHPVYFWLALVAILAAFYIIFNAFEVNGRAQDTMLQMENYLNSPHAASPAPYLYKNK